MFIIKWLQSVGRSMALNSYLLQTLICTTIFYRFGFFVQFGRLALLSFVPLIWFINIIFAMLVEIFYARADRVVMALFNQ
ncbi:DUF418 domain-containing protein [Arsenophonus endosymbiont of Aleurodicus floccissimus]|uniref:DUF418 domain-containing protein n=1 Tax=Arsenophonus endosymbiont of Aleurodicus floccissimus TaxID=2152761 RepID=UPI001EDEA2A9|nr:DUF418 domain-containing protein [Arsenophonus endosymbiont of Aleurodicus floccissimus]